MRSKTKKILGTILVCFGGGTLFGNLAASLMLNVSPVQSASDIRFIIIRALIFILGLWLISRSKKGDNLSMSAKAVQGLSIDSGTPCTLQAIEDSISIESSGSQIAAIKLLEIDSIEEDGSKLLIHTNNEDVSFDAIKSGDLKVFVRQVSEKVRLAKNKVIPYSPQQAMEQVVENSENLSETEKEVEAENNVEIRQAKTVFCRHCGAKLREDAKFCESCGTAV